MFQLRNESSCLHSVQNQARLHSFLSQGGTKGFFRSVLMLFGDKMNNRKIMVTFSLVEESQEKTSKELEEEISKELSSILLPWCKAIERVKSLRSNCGTELCPLAVLKPRLSKFV